MDSRDSTFQQGVRQDPHRNLRRSAGERGVFTESGRSRFVASAGFHRRSNGFDAPDAGEDHDRLHVDHVLYGFTLLNRWAAGEENPFADADWEASWRRTTANEAQWKTLRDDLRRHAETWRKAVAARSTWDDVSAAGRTYGVPLRGNPADPGGARGR